MIIITPPQKSRSLSYLKRRFDLKMTEIEQIEDRLQYYRIGHPEHEIMCDKIKSLQLKAIEIDQDRQDIIDKAMDHLLPARTLTIGQLKQA
jgi:hypothetical protein